MCANESAEKQSKQEEKRKNAVGCVSGSKVEKERRCLSPWYERTIWRKKKREEIVILALAPTLDAKENLKENKREERKAIVWRRKHAPHEHKMKIGIKWKFHFHRKGRGLAFTVASSTSSYSCFSSQVYIGKPVDQFEEPHFSIPL